MWRMLQVRQLRSVNWRTLFHSTDFHFACVHMHVPACMCVDICEHFNSVKKMIVFFTDSSSHFSPHFGCEQPQTYVATHLCMYECMRYLHICVTKLMKFDSVFRYILSYALMPIYFACIYLPNMLIINSVLFDICLNEIEFWWIGEFGADFCLTHDSCLDPLLYCGQLSSVVSL